MHRHWYSGKALLLHVVFVTVASLCLLAGWWQVDRARSGNLASYGYAVEWPVFAIVAGYFWWQLIHDHPKDRPGGTPPPPLAPGGSGEGAGRLRDEESPQLQAYNDSLSALAAEGRPKTWRNPKGLP